MENLIMEENQPTGNRMRFRQWMIPVVIVILFAIMASVFHNKAVELDEKVNASWSQVLNQYKRRTDLIPNLVSTVKGYASHEYKVLTEVTKMRTEVGRIQLSPEILNNPEAFVQFEKSQSALSSALSRLLMVAEQYPDLKANQNFLALQSQLEGTENRISVARRDYIDTVREYNTMLRRFPAHLFLSITDSSMQTMPTFTIAEEQTKVPVVSF